MSLLHHIDDKNQLFLFQKTKSIVIFTSIFLSLFINAACVKLNTKTVNTKICIDLKKGLCFKNKIN